MPSSSGPGTYCHGRRLWTWTVAHRAPAQISASHRKAFGFFVWSCSLPVEQRAEISHCGVRICPPSMVRVLGGGAPCDRSSSLHSHLSREGRPPSTDRVSLDRMGHGGPLVKSPHFTDAFILTMPLLRDHKSLTCDLCLLSPCPCGKGPLTSFLY